MSTFIQSHRECGEDPRGPRLLGVRRQVGSCLAPLGLRDEDKHAFVGQAVDCPQQPESANPSKAPNQSLLIYKINDMVHVVSCFFPPPKNSLVAVI